MMLKQQKCTGELLRRLQREWKYEAAACLEAPRCGCSEADWELCLPVAIKKKKRTPKFKELLRKQL